MIDGMTTNVLPSLVEIVNSTGQLENRIYVKDESRYITLISGSTTARMKKKLNRIIFSLCMILQIIKIALYYK